MIKIEGVTALNAAAMTLKAAWRIDGKSDSRFIKVPYDAMMIGGRGGKSAACAGGACSTGAEGW